ncbi:glycosyl transferase [Nitrospira sp.]|nr:glycosyl transferase [Nitrospira sp.]
METHQTLDVKDSGTLHDYLADRLRGTWPHSIGSAVWRIRQRVMRRVDGERILLERYARVHGKPFDPQCPHTFTDKLFCRMIALNRRRNQLYTQLSDKYSARTYVEKKIGARHLVKLLWHGTDPLGIPFAALQPGYVIKTNHGSAQIIVVKGAVDREDVVRKLSLWLKTNYYWACREYQYYHITPRVMVEEYLQNPDGSGPLDYRIWCFNGIPEVIQVDNRAHDINPFFDIAWKQLDLYYREGMPRPAIPKPANLDQMLVIATQLASGLDFVRVDLYNIAGHIYFGEFTLTPTAGELRLKPASWDAELGEKWKMSRLT